MFTKKKVSQSTISQLTRDSIKSIDIHELQILMADILNKSKEFILAHPEFELTKTQKIKIKKAIARRTTGEPIAYIRGNKDFYNINFVVNEHTLIPRPETELMVDLTLNNLRQITDNKQQNITIDIGTGSGNIIISLAKTIECSKSSIESYKFFGIDISKNALRIARKNAKIHNVNKKIKFLYGDLLLNFNNVTMKKCDNLVILANLPYLSAKIYRSAPKDVKKFEPKSALYSPKKGLLHYKKLLNQLRNIFKIHQIKIASCFLEISPEQKPLLSYLVKKIFPKAKTEFHKDLAGKWRVCEIQILQTDL